MAGLTALSYIAMAASLSSTLTQGQTQEKIASIQASQLKKQAIADTADSVQTAKLERKKAALLSSRVTALAAASGSAVSSVDIQNSLSDIDEQGEYNALAALYSGQTAASSKRYQARVTEYEGAAAVSQSKLKAGATILSTMNDYG